MTGPTEQVSTRVARFRSQGDAHAAQGRTEAAHESWGKALAAVAGWLADPAAEQAAPPSWRTSWGYGVGSSAGSVRSTMP